MLDNNVLRKAAGTRDNDTRIPFCNERQFFLPNMAGLNHGSLMLMLRLKEWGWVSKAVAKTINDLEEYSYRNRSWSMPKHWPSGNS